MNPVVVLTAEQPENNNVVVVVGTAAAPDNRGKCIPLYVLLAAKAPKSPSSPETGGQYTVLTATLKRSGRDERGS